MTSKASSWSRSALRVSHRSVTETASKTSASGSNPIRIPAGVNEDGYRMSTFLNRVGREGICTLTNRTCVFVLGLHDAGFVR